LIDSDSSNVTIWGSIMAKYVLFRQPGQAAFDLRADNNERVFRSIPYPTVDQAIEQLQEVRFTGPKKEMYELRPDPRGGWYYVCFSRSKSIIGYSEIYSRKTGASKAIGRMMDIAGTEELQVVTESRPVREDYPAELEALLKRNQTTAETAICRGRLATPVDSFVFHATFHPLVLALPLADALQMRGKQLSWNGGERSPILAISKAGNPALAFRSDAVGKRSSLFAKVGEEKRTVEDGMIAFPSSSLGLLFLERLRVRPIGWTTERAPFSAITLTPGETVTLRQKSFTKRAVSLEEFEEEEAERTIERSSTFSTELTEEYMHELTKTQTSEGGFGIKIAKASFGLSGEISSETIAAESARQTAKEARELAQSLSSRLRSLHRTTVSVSREDAFEDEGTRTLRNDDTQLRKFLLRRLMQVLLNSVERYGVRLA
jgi:uncharacterized protein YegP (UPF0339 family)